MLFMFVYFEGCKLPTTPDNPVKTEVVIEFMYQRVREIINPNDPDPSWLLVYNTDNGGADAENFRSVGENKWACEALLE